MDKTILGRNETTTDLAAVREAALDLALATWYDEALRLLDAAQTDDPQERLLLALTATDVADRADHVFGRSEAPKRFEALDAELAAYEPDPSLAWNVAWVRVRRATRWRSATPTARTGSGLTAASQARSTRS